MPQDVDALQVFADEANAFMTQLQAESDRGAALVGTAYLDELLKRLFEARMLADKDRKALFESNGPLYNFRHESNLLITWAGLAQKPTTTLTSCGGFATLSPMRTNQYNLRMQK